MAWPTTSRDCWPPGSGPRSTAGPASGVEPLRRAVELATDRRPGRRGRRGRAGCSASASPRPAGTAARSRCSTRWSPATGRPRAGCSSALASATVASVHRQLGRHAVAQGYDERALEGSDGAGEAGFDALLGLAADAVGLGDAGAASTRLAEAAALAGGRAEWWRQRVRLGWVRAEVALLEGRPEDAVSAATEAVDLAEHSGAPRHVAKGLLFLGVAQLEAGRPDEAAARAAPGRAAGREPGHAAAAVAGPGRPGRPAGRGRARGERSGPRLGPPGRRPRSPTTCPRSCGPSGWPGPTWRPCFRAERGISPAGGQAGRLTCR